MAFERYALLALVLATGACAGGSGTHFTAARTLSTPTSVGTAPMVAISPTGALASAWVSAPTGGIDGRLYVEVDTSAAPAEIRDTLGPIEGHGEAPPKLAYGNDGSLNAIYVVVKDLPTERAPVEALRFVHSVDSGRTWTDPVTVTSDGVFGTHNFHALHVAHDGTIYVSWLGGPSGKSTPWVAHSTDGGTTWSPQAQVDTGQTCDCCRTSLGSAPDGTLYIAWRHVFPGNVREVVVARSTDHGEHWSAPVPVHVDGWVFNGCPRAGPSLQVDSAGHIHVAWWTGKSGAAGVWYARSDDGAKTFTEPVALGVATNSRAAHVQLALGTDGIVAAIWDDGTSALPRILFRLSMNGGRTFGAAEVLSSSGLSVAFPVLAVSPQRVTAAWTESGPAVPASTTMVMPSEPKGQAAHRGIKPIGTGHVVVRDGTVSR